MNLESPLKVAEIQCWFRRASAQSAFSSPRFSNEDDGAAKKTRARKNRLPSIKEGDLR